MSRRTPGPWQVTIARFEGKTTFRPNTHCKTSIAVDPRDYWDEGYEPSADEHGYFQPDENMDCDEFRIANARLIAAAPELLEALQAMLEQLSRGPFAFKDSGALRFARAAVKKATGETL